MASALPPRTILSCAQSLDGGGVERVLLRLAGEWTALGWRVVLVIGDTSGPLAAELPPGVEVRPTGSRSLSQLAIALAAAARELRPEVLFCPGNHYTGTFLLARLRLGRGGPPVVAKVSNRLARDDQAAVVGWGYRRWLRRHPAFVDRLVAMSPAMRDEAVAEMGFAADHVVVIPNPPVRHRLDGAPPVRERYLLGLGRLAPQKRWERLIAALPRLHDRSVKLVILGEGPERPRLEALVRELDLAERVFLPGYGRDPGPALAHAAAVVLVSDFEGVPGVLREALAVGTPVVATASSVAVREIVSSPGLGSVVEPDDEAALVVALDRWLAPGATRPGPVPEPGVDSAARYLALFDAVAKGR